MNDESEYAAHVLQASLQRIDDGLKESDKTADRLAETLAKEKERQNELNGCKVSLLTAIESLAKRESMAA